MVRHCMPFAHFYPLLSAKGSYNPTYLFPLMMRHETLQMIHERYYSYIKNYQRDDGKVFMENVYNATKDKTEDKKKDDVIEKAAN